MIFKFGNSNTVIADDKYGGQQDVKNPSDTSTITPKPSEPIKIDRGKVAYTTNDSDAVVRYSTKLDYLIYRKTYVIIMETWYASSNELNNIAIDGNAPSTVLQLSSNTKLHIFENVQDIGSKSITYFSTTENSFPLDSTECKYDPVLFVTPVIDYKNDPVAVLIGAKEGKVRLPYSYDLLELTSTSTQGSLDVCWVSFKYDVTTLNDNLKFYYEGTNKYFNSTTTHLIANVKSENLITNQYDKYKVSSKSDLTPETYGGRIFLNASSLLAGSNDLRFFCINMSEIEPSWTKFELLFSDDGGEVISYTKVSMSELKRELYTNSYDSLYIYVVKIKKTCSLILRNTVIGQEISLSSIPFVVNENLAPSNGKPSYITTGKYDFVLSLVQLPTFDNVVMSSDDFYIYKVRVGETHFIGDQSYRLYSDVSEMRTIDLTQTTTFANEFLITATNNFVKGNTIYDQEESVTYGYNTVTFSQETSAKTVTRSHVSTTWSAYFKKDWHPANTMLNYTKTLVDNDVTMTINGLKYGGLFEYSYVFSNFTLPVQIANGVKPTGDGYDFTLTTINNMITITCEDAPTDFKYQLVDVSTSKPLLVAPVNVGSYGVGPADLTTVNVVVVGIKDGIAYTMSTSEKTIDITVNNGGVTLEYDYQFDKTTVNIHVDTSIPLDKIKIDGIGEITLTKGSDGTYTGSITIPPVLEPVSKTVSVLSSDGVSLGSISVSLSPPAPFTTVNNHVNDLLQFKLLNPSTRFVPVGPYTMTIENVLTGSVTITDLSKVIAQHVTILNTNDATLKVVTAIGQTVINQTVKLYKNDVTVTNVVKPKDYNTNIVTFTFGCSSPYSTFLVEGATVTKLSDGVYTTVLPTSTTSAKLSVNDSNGFVYPINTSYSLAMIIPTIVKKGVKKGLLHNKISFELINSSVVEGSEITVDGLKYNSNSFDMIFSTDSKTITAWSGGVQVSVPLDVNEPLNKIKSFTVTAEGVITLTLEYPQTYDDTYPVSVNGVEKNVEFSGGVGQVHGTHLSSLEVTIDGVTKTVTFNDPSFPKMKTDIYLMADSSTNYIAMVTYNKTITTFKTVSGTVIDHTTAPEGIFKISLDYFQGNYVLNCPNEVTMLCAYDADDVIMAVTDEDFSPFKLSGNASVTMFDQSKFMFTNNGNAYIPIGSVSTRELWYNDEPIELYGTMVGTTSPVRSTKVIRRSNSSLCSVTYIFINYPYYHGMKLTMNGKEYPVKSLKGGSTVSSTYLSNKSCKYDPQYKDTYDTYLDVLKAKGTISQKTFTKVSGDKYNDLASGFATFYVDLSSDVEGIFTITHDEKGVIVDNYINTSAASICDMCTFNETNYGTSSMQFNKAIGAFPTFSGTFLASLTTPIEEDNGECKAAKVPIESYPTSSGNIYELVDQTKDFLTCKKVKSLYPNAKVVISSKDGNISFTISPTIANFDYSAYNADTRVKLGTMDVTSQSISSNVSKVHLYSPTKDLQFPNVIVPVYASWRFDYDNTYKDGKYYIKTSTPLSASVFTAGKAIQIGSTYFMIDSDDGTTLIVTGPQLPAEKNKKLLVTYEGFTFDGFLAPDLNFNATIFKVSDANSKTYTKRYGDYDGKVFEPGTTPSISVKFSEIPSTIDKNSVSIFDYQVQNGTIYRSEVMVTA